MSYVIYDSPPVWAPIVQCYNFIEMIDQTFKRTLSNFLENEPQVSLAYLFGSQIEGNLGLMSDVDVGILLENNTDSDDLQARLAHEISKLLDVNHVDVVLLNHAPIELNYGIIAQGECIFKRDEGSRVEFEAKILSLYGDYLPVLREQREDILRVTKNENRIQRYREALRRTERTLSKINTSQR